MLLLCFRIVATQVQDRTSLAHLGSDPSRVEDHRPPGTRVALLRLLPASDHDKNTEILALRHQVTVLHRQLGATRPRFSPADRAFLAALLHRLPRDLLGRIPLLVHPDTILRWHWNLIARHHATRSRPRRPGRPRTVRSIQLLALHLARENPSWGYRRIHGELLTLGIKIAASTVREILRQAGMDPAPGRTSITWASFLRSQADALLACDFFETVTLTGTHLFVLAVIEYATRRIRILGATPHPTPTGSPRPPGTSSWTWKTSAARYGT
jgi:putative transposase